MVEVRTNELPLRRLNFFYGQHSPTRPDCQILFPIHLRYFCSWHPDYQLVLYIQCIIEYGFMLENTLQIHSPRMDDFPI